jgi:hypothetical protein
MLAKRYKPDVCALFVRVPKPFCAGFRKQLYPRDRKLTFLPFRNQVVFEQRLVRGELSNVAKVTF